MENLLHVKNLTTIFQSSRGNVKAVDSVSFNIKPREVLGLVGESGSGKTTTARSIVRLLPEAGRITSGEVLFKGKDLLKLPEEELRGIRGREITWIPQNPMSSLNPAFRIKDQMIDVLQLHKGLGKKEAFEEAASLLRRVGITEAEKTLMKYPSQLSGGMCQRVLIAVAFSCNPSLVIADEPTTALDVITQAAVVKLINEIRKDIGTSMLLITHNMGLARHFCDRIAIMYAGKIVEEASTRRIFEKPLHPYTQTLLEAIPTIYGKKSRIAELHEKAYSSSYVNYGCVFYPRCGYRMPRCKEVEIPYFYPETGHRVACLLYEKEKT